MSTEAETTLITHAEFNAFVQSVQRDAQAWQMETQLVLQGGRNVFQVFYGDWHTLAEETPFMPDPLRNSVIHPDRWNALQARMARDLTR